MNFLDEMGKEDVQQKKRRGKKHIVVDSEAATRYVAHHDRCDGKRVRPTWTAYSLTPEPTERSELDPMSNTPPFQELTGSWYLGSDRTER